MTIRNVLTVTSLGHALNHSLTLIYPVVMIKLADLYPQVSLTTFGLLGTIHYFLYGLGAVPAGWLTDRLGARAVLSIYFFGSAASVIYLTFTHGLVHLGIGLALLGLACSLYHPSGLTLISTTSPRISRHLGIHGIGGSLGLALGPLVAGPMADWFGWQSPFLLFGFLALVAGIYLHSAVSSDQIHTSVSESQIRRPTHIRLLILCYIVGMFMGLAHRGTLTFLPLYFAASLRGMLSPVMVGGLLTALVLACGILGQSLGGWLGDRFSRSSLLWVVVALNIPFLLLITLLQNVYLVIMAAIWGIINFAYQPIANALVSDYSSARRRGLLFGILNGLTFGVGAGAATAAGAIGDYWGTAQIFAAMGIILLPGVVAAVMLRHRAGEHL